MKGYFRLLLALLLGLAISAGCVPLTFSHDAALDFETYRRARVEVTLTDAAVFYGAPSATEYLVGELQAGSGFESVTSDPAAAVDVILSVRVSLVENIVSTDSGTEVDYDGLGRFEALNLAGRRVDSGSVNESGSSAGEVVEDALDEVALHYLRPYRL